MVQALFIRTGITVETSRHAGVIGAFDKQFILTGKIDKKYSKSFHSLFDDRQESDYKDFVKVLPAEADKAIAEASEFINALKKFLQ